jgi:sRNA-binding protein
MPEQTLILTLRQAIEDAKARIAELRKERQTIDDEINTLEAEIESITKPPKTKRPYAPRKCPTCREWKSQCTCKQTPDVASVASNEGLAS